MSNTLRWIGGSVGEVYIGDGCECGFGGKQRQVVAGGGEYST